MKAKIASKILNNHLEGKVTEFSKMAFEEIARKAIEAGMKPPFAIRKIAQSFEREPNRLTNIERNELRKTLDQINVVGVYPNFPATEIENALRSKIEELVNTGQCKNPISFDFSNDPKYPASRTEWGNENPALTKHLSYPEDPEPETFVDEKGKFYINMDRETGERIRSFIVVAWFFDENENTYEISAYMAGV